MNLENEGENGTVDAQGTVLLENGEPVAASISIPQSDTETGGNIEGEQSDAVAIAETQAEATIAVAAIEADVEQARIDADLERERIWAERNAEVAALQASMQERDRELAELRERLSMAEASLSNPTPQPELEEAAEVAAELAAEAIAPEESSTQLSIPENETGTELGQEEGEESAAAVAVAVAVPARKRRRLI